MAGDDLRRRHHGGKWYDDKKLAPAGGGWQSAAVSDWQKTSNASRLPVINRDWLVFGLSFLFDLCIGGVWFVVARRLSEDYKALGVSEATEALHLGLLGGAMFLTYTAGTLVSGRLSDRWGRRRLMVAGAGLYAVAAFLFRDTREIVPLTLLMMLLGLGGAIFWPPTIAWLSENKSGASLRWVLGVFCVAWNLGILIGNGLAGLLFVWSPRGAIEVFVAAMTVGALAILWPSRAGTGSGFARALPEEDQKAAREEARSHRYARAAWAANFVAIFGLAGATSLFPQLATSLRIEPPVHGALMAAIRFTAIAAFVAVQFTVGWRHRSWPLVASQAVGLVSVGLIALGETAWIFCAAFLLMGLAGGFNYFASVYYSVEAYPHAKGKGTGFHEAVLGAGLLLGPVLAGAVGAWANTRGAQWGLRAPYWFCAAMFALGALIQAVLALRGKRTR